MQSDMGKLFICGISWDTNEVRLKEYFSSYGQVLEVVIMKDHITGWARVKRSFKKENGQITSY
ncbi:putative RNA recognition motif domain, nucleotide-binding alpha-beta plait domain superfamily [Helianthus annuus]|nr:putative RNA recognition motif domain, nucleotide-binding alpha-beta plait domain superfamily [Helianthus annuus]